jgi:hypothetical protein
VAAATGYYQVNLRLFAMGTAALILPDTAVAAAPTASDSAGASEMEIAFEAAEAAYKADNINSARSNLQRAINCLGGPKNKNFMAAAGNPCAKQGQGAIPDVEDASFKQQLGLALGEASDGLSLSDLNGAQSQAMAAMDYMRPLRDYEASNQGGNGVKAPATPAMVKIESGDIRLSQLKGVAVTNREGGAAGAMVGWVIDTERRGIRLFGLKPVGQDKILAFSWSALSFTPAADSVGIPSLKKDAATALSPFAEEARSQPSYLDVEDNLIGRGVVRADGETVGKVDDLVIEPRTGIVQYVLVSANAASGNSGKSSDSAPLALRWTTFADFASERDIVLKLDEKQLAAAPHLQPG